MSRIKDSYKRPRPVGPKAQVPKRPNVGQISSELALKDPGDHTVAEQGKEQLKGYLPNLVEATEVGKKERPSQDFYLVVLTKRERLMSNVFRHYFFTRASCPTPDYDQAVYYYSHLKDAVEFLWVVPDPKTAEFFRQHDLEIPPEDKCLLEYVFKFYDGSLDRLAKKLNNETEKQINPIVRIHA
jgi:hypothetical protein